MTDKHTLVDRLEALRLFLSGVGDLDGLSFGEPKAISPTRQGLFWWRRSHLPVITEAATRITALEAEKAELVEALRRTRVAFCAVAFTDEQVEVYNFGSATLAKARQSDEGE